MKDKNLLIWIFFICIFLNLSSGTTFAESPQINSKIVKSFLSDDTSYNGFALSMNDCVKAKNIRSSFTLTDKKVTWSAVIRGGLGTYNVSDYIVCWYAPDGSLFEKQNPKMLFIDCAALKSSLAIDEMVMKSKIGLWKAQVIYKDGIIDNKYFYLTETNTDKKEILQNDMDLLDKLMMEKNPPPKPVEVPVVEKVREEVIVQQSAIRQDVEKPSLSNIQIANKHEEVAENGQKAINKDHVPHETSSEHLDKLESEIITETKQMEDLLYRRGALYEDKEVIDYINSTERQIAPEIDLGGKVKLDVKIIREPTVNAFAMATGSIYIHTGALARLENEAQLAYLLAHETSHVVHKDIVNYTDSLHNKTIVYKLLDIALAPTSVFFGILGDLTQLGFGLFYISTVTGYGRNIEARSDIDGIPKTIEEGYHPSEAAAIMQILLKEKEKYQRGPEIFFLMNHPTTEWRLGTLKKLIKEKYGEKSSGELKSEEFLTNMTKIKLYNATLNMRSGRLEHARDNIQWVLDTFPKNPEAHYLAGEIWRLKAEDKDRLKDELNYQKWTELNKGRKKGELEETWRSKALEEYNCAIQCDPKYSNAYKGLGMLHSSNNKQEALLCLNKYIELVPDAADKRYVKSLIERLSRPSDEKKDKKERR